MGDIWVKRDNYGLADKQVTRLIVECCTGRARVALEMLPKSTQRSEAYCAALEGEFYSDAKQTASSLMFITRVRHHGEIEHENASALKKLALHAYKDASLYHIECRCREQFLAHLCYREVRSHLGWFCSRNAKVHKLLVALKLLGPRARRQP